MNNSSWSSSEGHLVRNNVRILINYINIKNNSDDGKSRLAYMSKRAGQGENRYIKPTEHGP
jgi:hypothetical protein